MDSSKGYDFSFYVAFAGNVKVGKTNLCGRITRTMSLHDTMIGADNKNTPFRFSDKYNPTIGAEPWCICEIIDEKKVRVFFYDVSGQERFKPITRTYLSTRTDAIFLVYDLTDRKSFEDIIGWRNFIKENTEKEFSFILVGNKCDMKDERQVSYDEGSDLARELQIKFIETSAKTEEGVMTAFHLLLKEKMQQVERTKPSGIIHLNYQKGYADKINSKCT